MLTRIFSRVITGARLHGRGLGTLTARPYPQSGGNTVSPIAQSGKKPPLAPSSKPKLPDHLARQLSKFSIPSEEYKAWSKLAETFPQKWNKYPITCSESGAMIHVFPEYESKGLKRTHKESFATNVLLEVRDVRVPGSCHHPSYSRLARHRKHLICYTHADLIDNASRSRVKRWTEKSWPKSECIFVDTRETRKDHEPFSELRDWLIDTIDERGGVNYALTVGVPNTGKSSMLLAVMRGQQSVRISVGKNVTKKGKPAIENTPGKTREFAKYVLEEKPRKYCLDVPGVTPPLAYFEERPEAWYALCAANLLRIMKPYQSEETDRKIAEYVLFVMNRDRIFGYVKKLGLERPTCDIHEAVKNLKNKGTTFLKLFNTGNFGSVVLDDLRENHGMYKLFRFTDENMQKENKLLWKRDD